MKNTKIKSAIIMACLLAMSPATKACTTLLLKAKDGAVVIGRTMEFGFNLKSEVMVIPAGTEMTGSLPGGIKGISYKTKYGMVGANALGFPVIVDGINEKGLSVSDLYFPDYAEYTVVTPKNASRAMASYEFGNWLLGNFSTVEEVQDHLSEIVLAATSVNALGGPPPLHFIVRDRSGKSLVIEPIGGKLKVFDNPIGVLTNSPTFDWHLTNLRNYAGLRAQNVAPLKLRGDLMLTHFGQGTGMIGLPGDSTPPSRFIRAVAYSQTALPADNAADEVLEAFHIMNSFDIPFGSVRDKVGDSFHIDYTIWTSIADLENARWYFRTYDDQSIRMIDLATALVAASGKVRFIPMDSRQNFINMSKDFNK